MAYFFYEEQKALKKFSLRKEAIWTMIQLVSCKIPNRFPGKFGRPKKSRQHHPASSVIRFEGY